MANAFADGAVRIDEAVIPTRIGRRVKLIMSTREKTYKVDGELGAKLQRLRANGMLLCECEDCVAGLFLIESNMVPDHCRVCGSKKIKTWVSVDLTAVPEKGK